MDAPAQIFLLSLCGQAAGAALLAGVLFRLSRHFPRGYLPWWAAAWAAAAIAHAAAAGGWTLSATGAPPSHAGRLIAAGLSSFAGLSHALFMVQGARLVSGRSAHPRRRLLLCLLGLLALPLLTVAISTHPAFDGAARLFLRYSPRFLGMAGAYLVAGVVVLRYGSAAADAGLGRRVVGSAFLALAVQQQLYFLFTVPQLEFGGLRALLPYAGFADLMLQWVVSIGLVGWLLEDERGRAVEAFEHARVARQALEASLSARQSLEGQLRQSQKLEAIGQLTGGIAHDFNNMLTAIVGHAELIDHELSRSDPRRAELQQIVKAARQAESLTRQLLQFSRRAQQAPVLLHVNDVVVSMERMLGRVLGEHIALAVRPGADVPPVLADQGQLEQMVLNLALNARAAMPSGGSLRIITGLADLGTGPDGTRVVPSGPVPKRRCVQLVIEDTGIGIPEEAMPRIFEPFFTTKAEGQGTGLGLAMVFATVTEAGGDIRVTSRPGEGTRFEIYLPAADPDVGA